MLKRLGQVVLIVGICGLGGCTGFKPLYGTSGSSGSVATDISAISVDEQHTRVGQIVRNELLDGSRPGQVRFALKLQVTEKAIDVATLSTTLGSRRRIALTAHYELIDLTTGKSVTSGDSFSNVEFNLINQPVADLQAADDARGRAGRELGQDLRLRIATSLSAARG